MPKHSRSELPTELRALDRRFSIVTVEVRLGHRAMSLERPRSADELISEADFAKDERLPYWADIWPSSTALAGSVIGLAGTGRRALELGCGVGLVTIAALRAGFDVVATDYYADALLFTRRNSRKVIGREPVTRLVDWRAFPTDLGRFDLLLASDVLYERAYATLVADAIVAALAPGGLALVADPGRAALLTFITACEQRGCRVGIRERVPWKEGEARQTITIHEVRAPERE
ncbi:MAG TPA: methyltransferase [Gemmatimonadaceae bacterium]|nr:methyltransferase [Gemmatimonadaceae bacterium]